LEVAYFVLARQTKSRVCSLLLGTAPRDPS